MQPCFVWIEVSTYAVPAPPTRIVRESGEMTRPAACPLVLQNTGLFAVSVVRTIAIARAGPIIVHLCRMKTVPTINASLLMVYANATNGRSWWRLLPPVTGASVWGSACASVPASVNATPRSHSLNPAMVWTTTAMELRTIPSWLVAFTQTKNIVENVTTAASVCSRMRPLYVAW